MRAPSALTETDPFSLMKVDPSDAQLFVTDCPGGVAGLGQHGVEHGAGPDGQVQLGAVLFV